MSEKITPEKIKLPKIKKLDDDVFCFENNEETVFMPKSKYEENEKKLKAFEIIKTKGNYLCIDYSEYENKYYIYDNEYYARNEITKEEYELLTEMLK